MIEAVGVFPAVFSFLGDCSLCSLTRQIKTFGIFGSNFQGMKKVLLLFVAAFAGIGHLAAQSSGSGELKMMSERLVTCDDMFYNALVLIPRFYEEKKYDSADLISKFVSQNCGLYEPVFSYQVLRRIDANDMKLNQVFDLYLGYNKNQNKSLNETNKLSESVISYLETYKEQYGVTVNNTGYPQYVFEVQQKYYSFIRRLAESLLNKPGLDSMQENLLRFYANPATSDFSRWSQTNYSGSVIHEDYKQQMKRTSFSYRMQAGLWTPNGNIDILGNHPSIGFGFGPRINKTLIEMHFDIAFIKSPRDYNIYAYDTVFPTHRFETIYFGFNIDQPIISTRKSEISLLGGTGVDILNIVENTSQDKNTNNAVNLYSFNLNGGLEYRYFYHGLDTRNGVLSSSYIGLQARFNLINYCNTNGTDLAGQYTLISLVWGGFAKVIH